MLLNEPKILRGTWKIAKIKEIKQNRDGEVRNVIVGMPHGKLVNR